MKVINWGAFAKTEGFRLFFIQDDHAVYYTVKYILNDKYRKSFCPRLIPVFQR